MGFFTWLMGRLYDWDTPPGARRDAMEARAIARAVAGFEASVRLVPIDDLQGMLFDRAAFAGCPEAAPLLDELHALARASKWSELAVLLSGTRLNDAYYGTSTTRLYDYDRHYRTIAAELARRDAA